MSDTVQTTSHQTWLKRLKPYREPDKLRSVLELTITIVPLGALWATAWLLVAQGWWWGAILVVPAAGFLVRLFMIQHDCGHGAFFGNRQVDDWIGRTLGVLTFTPYDCWRQSHAVHHASSGNLDERGTGDVRTLTVAEYRQLGRRGRLAYWLYRHPFVMFGIGPLWLFFLHHRLPIGMMRAGRTPWISAMGTNAAIAVMVAGLIWLVGWLAFLLIFVPTLWLAAAAGVWLFYVQHQFEETNWSPGEEWQFESAALHGSSFYDLPAPLSWLTANIGVHHVHHLSSRIPYYRLPEVLRDFPELKRIGRVGILDSVRAVGLVLWDEAGQRLISFREASGRPLRRF